MTARVAALVTSGVKNQYNRSVREPERQRGWVGFAGQSFCTTAKKVPSTTRPTTTLWMLGITEKDPLGGLRLSHVFGGLLPGAPRGTGLQSENKSRCSRLVEGL